MSKGGARSGSAKGSVIGGGGKVSADKMAGLVVMESKREVVFSTAEDQSAATRRMH